MSQYLQRNKQLLLHIAFWLAYSSFFLYQLSFMRKGDAIDWDRLMSELAFHMISMLLICYFNYGILLPRFLRNKNLGRYLVEFIPIFIIYSFFVVLGKRFIISSFDPSINWIYSWRFTLNVSFSMFFLVLFVGLIRFVEDWFELEAHKSQLENEQLISELKFLKAQVNPHFLFNTLNNLYYLSLNNSPNTPELIAQLSQMMRYMLYDSNHPRVALSKEVDYIKNYIKLEKLRLNEDVPIDLVIEGNIENVTIAPMILIPFIENAFKHGISNSVKGSWIKIDISINGSTCLYQVSNSKVEENKKTITEKSGIGLNNVKRRLDLSYPDSYNMQVDENQNSYTVTLRLSL